MFNYKKMQKIFKAKPDSFVQRGFEKVNCGDLNYYFKDNGSNILAVAHLDSVEGATHFKVLKGHSYDLLALVPNLKMIPTCLKVNFQTVIKTEEPNRPPNRWS